MKRVALSLALLMGVLVLAIGGWRVWQMRTGGVEDVLPEFKELEPGPRAPTAQAFGVTVGTTTLDEVNALAASRGWSCEDTSMRALMQKRREQLKADLEARKARGEAVDEKSGASYNYRSPKEKNPQVRLSCKDVDASNVGDRPRPPAEGRVLFVFDSAALPLRHVSYRRQHRTQAAALEDFNQAVAAMTLLFGSPSDVISGPTPTEGSEAPTFGHLDPVKREWNFADVHVKVNVLNMGGRGIDLLESVEVPLPTRVDAPTLPR